MWIIGREVRSTVGPGLFIFRVPGIKGDLEEGIASRGRRSRRRSRTGSPGGLADP